MLEKLSVMIVEDNPTDVYLIQESLVDAGVVPDPLVFADGDEAFQYISDIESRVPALAILDLNIPRRDGAEVLAHIRATPRFSSIPVIILSSSPQWLMKTHAAHADGYITKPDDLDSFLAIGTEILAIAGRKPSEIPQVTV